MDGLSEPKTVTRTFRGVRATGVLPLLMMAACAGSDRPPGMLAEVGDYRVGAPYQVGGTEFRPAENFAYDETGRAQVYPAGSEGRLTANGEVYRNDALTAAHPTLQLPALARVTNLENGRSVVVRVNDRGAFGDQLVDLSQRTADYLGFAEPGTAQVRLQVLPDESLALAELAGREGPPPPMAGSLRDPLVAARSRSVDRPAQDAPEPDASAGPTPPAPGSDPLMAGLPDGTPIPPAASDPLMDPMVPSAGEPAYIPGPRLTAAPPPSAAGAPVEMAMRQASAPVAAARTTARSVRANRVAGERPEIAQVFADRLEAALFGPLMASAADGYGETRSPDGRRQADPPAEIPTLAEAGTPTDDGAVAAPASALAEAILDRRIAADALMVADAELAAMTVITAQAEPAEPVEQTPGEIVLLAAANAPVQPAPAEPVAVAPEAPDGATARMAEPDDSAAGEPAETAPQVVAAMAEPAPPRAPIDPVIFRGGEVGSATAGPVDGQGLPELFAQHGEMLDDETAPRFQLTGSSPVRVFGRGPSVEVVTYIVPLAESPVEETATAGGPPQDRPAETAPIDALVAEAVFDGAAAAAFAAGPSDGAGTAPVETLVAEAAFDEVDWAPAATVTVEAGSDEPVETLVAEAAFDRVGSIETRSAPAAAPPVASAGAETAGPESPAAVQLAEAARPADSAGSHAAGYFVQFGAFSVAENADRMQNRVSDLGDVRFKTMTTSGGTQLTRVLVGPFASHSEAEAIRTGAVDSGLVSQALIVQN